MSITEFVNSHPLINWSGVEKQIDAPKGTIRVNGNRPIPTKYQPFIVAIIKDYGYTDDAPEQPAQATPEHEDMYEFTYDHDMIRYVSTDGLNRTIKPNGTHLYIKGQDLNLPFEYKQPY